MRHRGCGGEFTQYRIREHCYCFMRCSACLAYLGGDAVRKQVEALLRVKVRPSVTRA